MSRNAAFGTRFSAAFASYITVVMVRHSIGRCRAREWTQFPYCATHPPSMEIGEPVMVWASSEHRYTTIAPTASGVVNFNIGCFSSNSLAASLDPSVPASFARATS